jgi:flagellar basal-body rod protein FlgC
MNDPMQGVFRGFDIAGAGLRAELQRAEVGNAQKEPYRRKQIVFEEMLLDAQKGGNATMGSVDAIANGVQVAKVVEDQTAFPVFYQPGHPDADASGKVLGSNVDLFQELVDMQVIERSFDATLTALRSYRGMLQNTITNMSR